MVMNIIFGLTHDCHYLTTEADADASEKNPAAKSKAARKIKAVTKAKPKTESQDS